MSPPAAPSTTDAPPALTITVKNIPEFTRECSPVVGEEIKVKITTRNVLGDVIHSGEFNQADVKWVFFDRESPADKILDRELLSLPGVQRVCREVLEAVEDGHKQLADIATAAQIAPGAAACLLDSPVGCGLIVRERERGKDVYLP